MRHRHTVTAIAITALALTACSSNDEPDRLTAEEVATELADATGVVDLGDQTDNTKLCSNEAAGKEPHKNDCVQLIATYTVSIYEYETPAVAAKWVKEMKKVGSDWRQVDRFALAWTAQEQKNTSDQRRTELVAALEKLTASED
ncbi:hypothetical protein E3E14_07245 [Streptomyces sp. ICN441]|uniref:hypothetical protein n=1 Tax=Streptomyces sp. ICN441 TaxID=2558286 RepID=UPI00106AFA56|nr:hypothetical protein [Streptomyces sp. ICN441]TFE54536.1 hypothetical protein E3E14_07245 [Streptomyces sp. ICN441]